RPFHPAKLRMSLHDFQDVQNGSGRHDFVTARTDGQWQPVRVNTEVEPSANKKGAAIPPVNERENVPSGDGGQRTIKFHLVPFCAVTVMRPLPCSISASRPRR